MQVIAGKARRLRLVTVPGTDIRPTSGQIKETLFNILQPLVPGARFLDLFAGSGAIGIEALSRGAREAVFVDSSRAAVRCIRQNLEHTGLKDQAAVYEGDAIDVIRRLAAQKRCFDIIFLDPPYDADLEKPVLKAVADSGILAEEGIVIAEARRKTDFAFSQALGFTVMRQKIYKNNKHVFLRKEADP